MRTLHLSTDTRDVHSPRMHRLFIPLPSSFFLFLPLSSCRGSRVTISLDQAARRLVLDGDAAPGTAGGAGEAGAQGEKDAKQKEGLLKTKVREREREGERERERERENLLFTVVRVFAVLC